MTMLCITHKSESGKSERKAGPDGKEKAARSPDARLYERVVCDAEGHIYDFLEVMHQQQMDFIGRAADARSFTRLLLTRCRLKWWRRPAKSPFDIASGG